MLSRREFLGTSLGAGALALTPALLRALEQSGGTLIQRAIPSTGERVPVIGLSFSNHPGCADPAALKAVLKTMVDNGGRVYDALHGNATAEEFHARIASELGVQNRLFWSTRGTPPGGPGGPPPTGAAAVKAHIDTLLARTRTSRLDLVMLPPQDTASLAALKEEKKAGRVRHIGVQVITEARFPEVEAVMRNEPIDMIGVTYDVGSRGAEEKILPLALERKIGVMAFFPFSNNAGVSCGSGLNLFARVGTRPLPDWAAEFDAKTWAQFFLKYVISHPAITVARVGTTNPAHMLDNIGGGIGRLPDEATRKRMAALIDSFPRPERPTGPPAQAPAQGPVVAVSIAILDRYVGDYTTPSGMVANFRRDGDKLIVKPGGNIPEAALIPRSETRFQDPRGPVFEFQVDAQGKVTGAVLEQQGPQGPQKISLVRK